VDYTFPAEALRKALCARLKDNPLQDKKCAELLFTDTTATTLQHRATISAKNASNSSNAWRLRCGIREHLIHFIKEKYPDALPQL